MLVNIPLLDRILASHAAALGGDFERYRSHCYRVINFYRLLGGSEPNELPKLVIATAFHDLGIWTAGTFDYIPPSIALAERYLQEAGHAEWTPEVTMTIRLHHKITAAGGCPVPMVERFRKADWIDVSFGRRRFGLSRDSVGRVLALFPTLGFHRMLISQPGYSSDRGGDGRR